MSRSWHRRIGGLVIASSLSAIPLHATGDDDPCLGTFMGANLVASFLDISLTTSSLKLLNGSENPKLKRHLEWRLASAIQNARHCVENRPVVDPVALPNLVVNFRHDIQKAKTYIVDHQLQTVSLHARGGSTLKPLADLRLVEEWFSHQPLPPGSER
jgi:hypothetical protein